MDRHIQLLRLEVLVASTRIVVIPTATKRRGSRQASPTYLVSETNETKNVLTGEALNELALVSEIVSEALNKLVDQDTTV